MQANAALFYSLTGHLLNLWHDKYYASFVIKMTAS